MILRGTILESLWVVSITSLLILILYKTISLYRVKHFGCIMLITDLENYIVLIRQSGLSDIHFNNPQLQAAIADIVI